MVFVCAKTRYPAFDRLSRAILTKSPSTGPFGPVDFSRPSIPPGRNQTTALVWNDQPKRLHQGFFPLLTTKNINSPTRLLRGLTGANRISMGRDNSLALAWLCELAAADCEQRNKLRTANLLREVAANWRTIAAQR